MDNSEKQKILRSIFYPLLFIAILVGVKCLEIFMHTSFARYGLYPRAYSGLLGIITSPLLHSSEPNHFGHLFSNAVPLFVLGTMTFYFYRPIAFAVFFWVYLMSGIWLWAAGRGEHYHIGASGLVYGFASFLFFSGIIRRERTLMVLSLLVVFLYGSMIWGIFPIQPQVSWEAHLLGSLAGIITAYYFRKEGPQAKKAEWPEDDENDTGEWKLGEGEERP